MTGYLHELRCTNDPCRCRVLYRVTETEQTAYTSIAGVSGESDTIPRGASSVLTPPAARHRVSRGVRP